MRGFQAASFTLSDKTETILKNFSISYSMPSCIVLRSKIILMAAWEKTTPRLQKRSAQPIQLSVHDCSDSNETLFHKLYYFHTYIHSPNPEIFPNHRNLEYKKNYPLPKMPQC